MTPRTLHIGERVYACEPYGDYGIGIILSIDNKEKDYHFSGDELNVKVKTQLITEYGDLQPNNVITCDNQEIYQIVPNKVDCRYNTEICYECHRDELENDYPYFSPYLNENLFEIEIKTL